MAKKIPSQETLVQSISRIAAEIPPARALQLYEFALFLESHPLPGEDILEEEAVWDALFQETTEDQWAAMIREAEAEIEAGETFPMFNDSGQFIERK